MINALTDLHHPCQTLADHMTLREKRGDLRRVRLAYAGDGNNVAHSLLEAAALAGMSLHVATPPAILLRCLPDHRGEEVTAEVVDGPRSVVFDQAENRLHTAVAILHALVERGG